MCWEHEKYQQKIVTISTGKVMRVWLQHGFLYNEWYVCYKASQSLQLTIRCKQGPGYNGIQTITTSLGSAAIIWMQGNDLLYCAILPVTGFEPLTPVESTEYDNSTDSCIAG
jgi:hypothetical protein